MIFKKQLFGISEQLFNTVSKILLSLRFSRHWQENQYCFASQREKKTL